MNGTVMEQIREKIPHLSEHERAALAHDLVASLDGGPDANASAEWELEILRRLEEVEIGVVSPIGRAEFSRRLRGRI